MGTRQSSCGLFDSMIDQEISISFMMDGIYEKERPERVSPERRRMIKKYWSIEDDTIYIVGQTADIKSIYKSMARHNDYYYPLYTEFPKFSPYKRIYGISVDEDGWFHIVNSDLISDLIVNGLIK